MTPERFVVVVISNLEPAFIVPASQTRCLLIARAFFRLGWDLNN